MLGITTTNARVGGFRGGISAEVKTIYNRIIADGGVSNLTRLNFFVKGLKAIYGDLANVPVCYDAHWIGYKLGSGTGATAGQAAAKLYSLTVAGDAVQSTAASQPLLLAHNGASSDNYWWGSGVVSNFVETQTQSSLLFGADFSATFYCEPLPATTMELGGTDSGGVRTTGFYIGSDRNMRASYLNIVYTSTAMYAIGTKYFRYTMSGNNFQFYTSTDGINWVQLGSNLSVVVHTALPSNRIRVGNATGAYALPTNGKIYSAKFYTDANLTNLVFDFNPATYNASTSQTAWTSSTGEIWTISTGTAASGYKGVLVDRTIVQGDGVNDYLDNTTFVRNNTMTQYLGFSSLATSGGGAQIIDASTANYYNSVYKDSSFVASYLNGAGPNVQSISSLNNIRYILAANYNAGVSNNLKLNNSIGAISTYSPTPSATGIRLFSKGGTVSSHNATITTYVYCINNDTTNNTTMFNFLKTLNNL